MEKNIIFFIGTTAEYIKVFTIIEKCKELNIPYKVITSGQNEIIETDIAKATNLKIDLQLSNEKDIAKNVFGLFSWFFKIKAKATKMIKEHFTNVDFKKSIMVVHGDTLSTVMGAKIAKKLGMKVAHIEAGLRSHNWFSPFPEEFDRCIVSRVASFNFCPGTEPIKNLRKVLIIIFAILALFGIIILIKGECELIKIIGSVATTLSVTFALTINLIKKVHFSNDIDALKYSEHFPCKNEKVNELINDKYCVFVMHRQENLLQPKLVNNIVNKAIDVAKSQKVCFILHQITYNVLNKMDLLKKLESEQNIILLHRVEYFDFMKLLINSEFVITDGGSNQEELYYMGKPTLIMRSSTERLEGIGENALMYGGDFNNINKFVNEYTNYIRKRIVPDKLPTDIIVNKLQQEIRFLDEHN